MKAKILTIFVVLLAIGLGIIASIDPEVDMRIKIIHFVSTPLFTYFNYFGFSRSVFNLFPHVPASPDEPVNGVFSMDLVIPPLAQSVVENAPNPTSIRLRMYYPATISQKLPLLIYIHGGGLILGNVSDSPIHELVTRFTREGPFVSISVDYKLAPEHQFPAAVDDCIGAVKWALSTDNEIIKKHVDLTKIIVAGDSAGGYLTSVVSQYFAQNTPQNPISHQVLIYPSMHLPLNQATESMKQFQNGYIHNKRTLTLMRGLSRPKTEEWRNSYFYSPLNSKRFENLPSTQIIVGEYDPLRDEDIMYYNILKQSNVEVVLHFYHKMVHGFYSLAFLPEADKAFKDTMQVLHKKFPLK